MRDLNGRPYALVSEVVEGTILECDGDFTCLRAGDQRVVKTVDGRLSIDCDAEGHDLDGQLAIDEESKVEFYVGLYVVDNSPPA